MNILVVSWGSEGTKRGSGYPCPIKEAAFAADRSVGGEGVGGVVGDAFVGVGYLVTEAEYGIVDGFLSGPMYFSNSSRPLFAEMKYSAMAELSIVTDDPLINLYVLLSFDGVAEKGISK